MKSISIPHIATLAALVLLSVLASHARSQTWSPAALPDLALWLDGNDTNTLFLDTGATQTITNNGSIARWNDKSGNGRNFTQSTIANRPTYVASSINALGASTFNGAAGFMSAGDKLDLGAANLTVMTVIQHANTNQSGTIIAKSRYAVGSGRWGLYRLKDTSSFFTSGTVQYYGAATPSALVLSTNAESDTTPRLLGFDWMRTGTTSQHLYNNGSVLKSTNGLSADTNAYDSVDELWIGAYPSPGGTTPPTANSYLNGKIAEIVVTSTNLSTTDRQKVEGYLAWKWGLTNNLPADHPYKSVAPESTDTTPPFVVTLTPTNGATGVALNANLVATFSELIQKGTGNITLKKTADNSTVETFDVASSSRITVSGATLTIDPTSNLDGTTGYYVQIAPTAIKDFAGNSFAGIADTTSWRFTTGVAATPTPCAGLVLGDSTIAALAGGYTAVADFIYTPQQLSNGWSVTSIAVPGATIAAQKSTYLSTASRTTVDYTIVEIGLNDMAPAEAASAAIARLQDLVDTINASKKPGSLVIISTMLPCRQRWTDVYGAVNGPIAWQKFLDMNEAIKGNGPTPITNVAHRISRHTLLLDDGAGNLHPIYDTGDHVHENNPGRQIIAGVWRDSLVELGLLTSEFIPLGVAAVSPADNATGVAVGTNLVLALSGEIALGTGNITIRNLTDATQVTIPVTDASQVSSAGAILTINPTADLAAGKDYAVRIAANAIKDTSDNFFAGISDDTTWNFTTVSATESTTRYFDFATDPNIAGNWANNAFYGSAGTATWNSGPQTLGLAASGNRWSVLRRAGTLRGPTDPVTLKFLSHGALDGTWCIAGLTISSDAAPTYSGTAARYEFTLVGVASGWSYMVKRAPESEAALFLSAAIPYASLTFPIQLDIVRKGTNYDFKVNGATVYTASYYTSGQHDSMVYYHVTFGSDAGGGGWTATVDNFGVPPPLPPAGTVLIVQ